MSGLPKKTKLSGIPDQQPLGQSTTPVKDEPINRTSSTSKETSPPASNANANSAQIQEEKRQAVRKLIESIPTKKEDLFAYPLDWSSLDAVCLLSSFFVPLLHFSILTF